MEIIPVTDDALIQAAEVVKNGGVTAHATETCYGFACDLTNLDAVKKLFAIKNRPGDMPVSALFPSVEEAKMWVEWNEAAGRLADMYLPGPLTIVLGIEIRIPYSVFRIFNCPEFRIPDSEFLGVRISSHPAASRLAELSGIPISTTSANLHGEPNPYSVEEIARQFSAQAQKPDLVLDSGVIPKAESSTVVIIKDGTIKVLRQGSIQISSANPQNLTPNT